MTVASRLKQSLATLKHIEAGIHTFMERATDDQVKREFQSCQESLERIINRVETRIKEIELEEPQFKGF